MKNIISEKPSFVLEGRLLFTMNFVDEVDLKSKDILNVGCGYGWFELNVVDRNIKNIVGIEITEEDILTAMENVKDERVNFRLGSATELSFLDNSFDTVTSWEVIEHIPKHEENEMFFEINRILKMGGAFYMSTPNKGFLSNLLDPGWYFGHRHYGFNDLKNIAEKNGFIVEKFMVKGGILEMLSTLDMYFSKWILRRGPVFRNFFKGRIEKEYTPQYSGTYDLFIKFKKIKNVK